MKKGGVQKRGETGDILYIWIGLFGILETWFLNLSPFFFPGLNRMDTCSGLGCRK